jgi:dTDP-3-amino-3,4,6-trideoxy-alpha-D-glucose transaminase
LTAVRYVNFQRSARQFEGVLLGIAASVLDSGTYIGGPELTAFEEAFAAFCGTRHAIGVANGQDALELTLRAWEIGPGDEVIVPANTAIPTALAVTHAGATLVLVDVEEETGLIDPAAVAAALTSRTRAIVPVHLYGHPVAMPALRALGGRHGVHVLEDAAHAHGARLGSRRCGALGDAAAFSFYPTKNLGALGDGGCVTTDDDDLALRIRRLRNLGLNERHEHVVQGFNSRLDPLQAAILRWKLDHLDAWNARRTELAERYCERLADVAALALPVVRDGAFPVWHAFAVRIRDGRRDVVKAALGEAGIETNIHYRVPVHLQPCYAGRWSIGAFPVSERRALDQLSLPLDPFHTDEEIDRVADALCTSSA